MKYFFTCESVQSITDNCENKINAFALKGSCPLIKSKLLYEIANEAGLSGMTCEKFLSPFNYEELACVYIKRKNCIVYDSEYLDCPPEGAKTINIDELCGGELPTERIEKLERNKYKTLSRAAKEKNSAAVLQKENERLSKKYISKAKILNYILRFVGRNGAAPSGKVGKMSVRSISGITAWGVHSLYETVFEDCNRIYTVTGTLRHANTMLISGLCEAFLQLGCDVTVFKCSLTGEAEHLCVPSLCIAFLSDNDYHFLPYIQSGEIHTERFLKSKLPESVSFRINLNEEQIDDYIGRSVFSMYDALEMHNALSDLLFDAQNEYFDNKLKPRIISEVLDNN